MIKYFFGNLILFCIFFSPAFAGDNAELNTPAFSGTKAMNLLNEQCAMGYRIPGTPQHEKCLQWMKTQLEKNNFSARIISESAYIKLLKKQVNVQNLFGIYNPQAEKKVLISAHWDTRPIADRDTNPSLRNTPIIGANDGASGVAVLLELARAINESKQFEELRKDKNLGIILAFYDAEDCGNSGTNEDWCIGSKLFAASIPADMKFIEGINIDMIGDKDLQLYMEIESLNKYPAFTQEIWQIGQQVNSKTFIPSSKYTIIDDHSSFFETKIPYINIIDFDYPYWHTQSDTPEKCSEQSLQTIGNTLVKYLHTRIKNHKKTLDN